MKAKGLRDLVHKDFHNQVVEELKAEHKAANELKIWGEEKPEVGAEFLFWGIMASNPDLMRWHPESNEVVSGCSMCSIRAKPRYHSRWCYVPGPPDWDAIGRES